MNRGRKVELLSPAGNEEGFYGAIHAGADAVYLAGTRFGARAYADNFSDQALAACIRYGHLMGRKIYLAVNTLLKEDELAGLHGYLDPLYEAGLDAVIVQDLGVLRLVREHFPGLKVHVSTQMTLCGSYGAALLKSMGASRIVPARELSLQELAAMRQNAGIEIESFIHGAMCYCYSGQCLFSSILGGRSGNRGRCAQPCRLPYSAAGDLGQKECYPLSLKDLCAIGHIPRLAEAGIDSFKIEGRMKKPEYTAGVTAIYRRYIDLYYSLREKNGAEKAAAAYHVDRADMEQLKSLYIRGKVMDGYYFRHGGREMVTLENPAYSGSNEGLLAEIRKTHIASREKLPVSVKAVFRVGQPAEAAYTWEGRSCIIRGDIVERAGKQPITAVNIRKQLGKLGDSAFQVSGMEISVDGDSFYPLKQINGLRRAAIAGLEEEILRARGYTGVCRAADGRAQAIGPHPTSSINPAKNTPNALPAEKCHVVSVCTLPQLEAAAGWFSKEKTGRPLRIYIEGDLFLCERQKVLDICSNSLAGSSIYLALPYILREPDRPYLEQLSLEAKKGGIFRGFLARSMDGLGFARELGGNLCCRADAGVYAWNRQAVQELSAYTEGFCLPYELRVGEQSCLLAGLSCEKIVYGRIPMMLTANCLLRTFRQCRKAEGDVPAKSHGGGKPGKKHIVRELSGENGRCRQAVLGGGPSQAYGQTAASQDRYPGILKDRYHAILKDRYHAILKDRYHAILKDRYRREFPVVANCLHCMNIIYNSVPLSLHQTVSKWEGLVDLRMDFTLEPPDEVRALLDCFLKGAPFPLEEYTTGHEKRGAE